MSWPVTPQYPESDLNKIAKTFNKTNAGLKSTLQRFRIYFFEILALRAWNPPAR